MRQIRFLTAIACTVVSTAANADVGTLTDGAPWLATMADGRTFEGIEQFKKLLLEDERQIARNLVNRLVLFATGAPVSFADRVEVEEILDRAAPGGYGVRTLIHEVVQSPLFRMK